jgi:hypothetical protein
MEDEGWIGDWRWGMGLLILDFWFLIFEVAKC